MNPRRVESGSLLAFGIFLHALADTYSHEACQEQCAFQGHSVQPPKCTAFWWHWDAEYGPAAQNHGAPYTEEAALAVWQALRHHPSAPPAAKWSDAEARQFITPWVAEDQASTRQSMADQAFAALGG